MSHTRPLRSGHATSRLLREGPPPEPQEPGQGHAGANGESDLHVMGECAVLDAEGVLGVGKSSIYELHANERLPAPIQVGRGRRWVRAEIEAWVLYGAPSRASWERLWPRVRKEVLRRWGG